MSISIARDERESAVDAAADRIAYLVLSFGLLGVVAWRSFVSGESPWDLLALVIVAGGAGTAYRVRQRVVTQPWLAVAVVSVAVAVVVGALLALGIGR